MTYGVTIMPSKLFSFLKFEQQLLSELVRLAERQQKALIAFDATELDEIASYQEELAKSLRNAEEQRINFIMAWLQISRTEAANLRLSSLEKKFNQEEMVEIKKLRASLRAMISKLQNFNTANRVLANRAKNSIKDMMTAFTRGNKHVCNVRV